MSICRVCLHNKPKRDVTELKLNNDERKPSYEDIMKFCLGIQIAQDQVTTKLCTKCFKKIIEFYQFKALALKSDEHLHSLASQINEMNEINEKWFNNDLYVILSENNLREEILEDDDLQGIDNKSYVDKVMKEERFEPIEIDYGEWSKNNKSTDEIPIEVKEEYCQEERLDDDPSSVGSIIYEYVKNSKENAPAPKKTNKLRKNNVKRNLRKKIYRQNKILDICPECGKQVKCLKTHLVTHYPNEQRTKFKCDFCYKVFKTTQGRNKHQKGHIENPKQQCSICKIEVLHLKAHMKTVHQPEARRFQCSFCNQKFTWQTNLNRHLSIHTNEKPFQCDECELNFRTKRLVNIHKRRIHLQEKCFQCDICSRSFFMKERLKDHIRLHTKEKPYICPECGKTFPSGGRLREHRHLHSGKTFDCTECKMKFSMPKYLRAHVKTHLKVKRYPCRYCTTAFYRSDHRSRHEFTAHNKHKIKGSTPKT